MKMTAVASRPSGLRGLFSRVSQSVSRAFRRGPEIEPAVRATYPLELTVYPPGEAPVVAHAAARWSGAQSWLPAFVQDAAQDLCPGDRLEIMRRARYFGEWSSLLNKVLWLLDTNCVGTGIMPTPDSASKRFNARALDYWNEIVPVLDITETIPFYDAQSIIERTRALDGEIFVWLTWADAERKVPRIKLIESHRVVSAGVKRYTYEGYTEFDGMLFDQRGRPEFYIVTNDYDAFSSRRPEKVAIVPRSQMVHFFRPRRAGQVRGLSLFAPVLHDVHDLDDLQQYEMMASKDAAERVRTIYNEKGEAPAPKSTVVGQSKQIAKADGSTQEATVYYERKFGGRTVYMRNGDKAQLEEPLRPTAAQVEFWDRLERKFAQGSGPSLAAIMDYAGQWGGAAARGAVANDNRFYDQEVWSLVNGFQRIYEHVMSAGILAGKLGLAPADWRKSSWQPPRRATVDIGRDGKQLLSELRAGIRTKREIIGELGYDYNEVREQRKREVKADLDAAIELVEDPNYAKHGLTLDGALKLLSENGDGITAPENAAAPAPAAANQPAAAAAA